MNNVTTVIPMLDPIIHTAENGYTCSDPTCPCQNLPWDDDSPYEPYYSRADQERDQAIADYYDGRGLGQVS